MGTHGECSQFVDHTAFATGQGGTCFLGLHCSGSRVLYKGTVPSVLCIWCASQVQAAQVLRWWERGLYGSWLALLWYLLNPLFCEHVRGHLAVLEPFVVKVFFFFLVFLEIPWFGLLSPVSSLRLSSGHSGLVMQPTPPCPALTCWWRMRVSGLLHRQLRLGAYSLGFFNFNFYFSSWLCCPLRFQNSPQSTCERISYFVGNFSFMTPTPAWVSVPKTFVSVFVFYILSYLLLKRLGCLPGCLVSSASVQNLFCGSC